MKPVLQSLLLADHVYSDQATGKKIIAGVFNRVQRMKAPPKPPEGEAPRPVPIPAGGLASTPFVYMAITELHGKCDFILELTDLAENVGMFKVGFTVDCKDPLQTVEVHFPIPALALPHAGVYSLGLLWKDELLGALRILAADMEPPPPPEERGAQ